MIKERPLIKGEDRLLIAEECPNGLTPEQYRQTALAVLAIPGIHTLADLIVGDGNTPILRISMRHFWEMCWDLHVQCSVASSNPEDDLSAFGQLGPRDVAVHMGHPRIDDPEWSGVVGLPLTKEAADAV